MIVYNLCSRKHYEQALAALLKVCSHNKIQHIKMTKIMRIVHKSSWCPSCCALYILYVGRTVIAYYQSK